MIPFNQLTKEEKEHLLGSHAVVEYESTASDRELSREGKVLDITDNFIELDSGHVWWAGTYEGVTKIIFEGEVPARYDNPLPRYKGNGRTEVPEVEKKRFAEEGRFTFE